MTSRGALVVCLGLLLPSAQSASGNDRSPTLALTEEQGLAIFVQAMAEMQDGAIAFGGEGGLAIFRDGKIRTYTGPHRVGPGLQDPREVPGNSALPSNSVSVLLAARDGTL